MKKRVLWLDIMRIFAIFCVLICHSPAPYDGLAGGRFFISAFNYYGLACGPNLFFMISGALLLTKVYDYHTFLRKKILRIVLPLVFWSLTYLLLDAFIYKNITINDLLCKISLIPFYAQVPQFWFLYAILGIYIITPILSKWLHSCSKQEVKMLLLFWLITLLLPYLIHINSSISEITSIGVGWLHYCVGYCGYALLGYYIKTYIDIKHIKFSYLFVTLILIMILPGILEYVAKLPHEAINHQRSLNMALMSGVTFCIIMKIFISCDDEINKKHQLIIAVSNYSFGVYLVHLLFLPLVKYYIAPLHINYLIQIPLTAIVIGFISLLFVFLLSKFKIAKYIIG